MRAGMIIARKTVRSSGLRATNWSTRGASSRAMMMGATLLGTAAVMQDQISAEGSISTADTTVNQNTAPCASGIYLESLVLKDKRRLAYRVQGEGVPIYLLHGMGSSHLTWRTKPEKDLAQLCPGVRLILIDRPGYGDSDMPPAGYSYTQWAEDLAQLADHLGDSTFAVAGVW